MTPEHKKRLAEGLSERRKASFERFRGLFASLEACQKRKALSYRGEENHGDEALKLKPTDTGSVT